MRRIHHPGLADGANVRVCLHEPWNVPTPATGASPSSVRRAAGKGHDLPSASRVSSICSALNRS